VKRKLLGSGTLSRRHRQDGRWSSGGASLAGGQQSEFLLFDKAQSQNNLVSDFLPLPASYLRLSISYRNHSN
jgi:hypothetical protein